MKKIFLLSIMLIAFITLPKVVQAADYDFTLTCDQEGMNVGDKVTCTVTLGETKPIYESAVGYLLLNGVGVDITNVTYGSAFSQVELKDEGNGFIEIYFKGWEDDIYVNDKVLSFDIEYVDDRACPNFNYYGYIATTAKLIENIGEKLLSDGAPLPILLVNGACNFEASTNLVCDKTSVMKGDIVTCDVFVSSFANALAVNMSLSIDPALKFSSISYNPLWQGTYSSGLVGLIANKPTNILPTVAMYTIKLEAIKDFDVAKVKILDNTVTNSFQVVVDMNDDEDTVDIGGAINNPETGTIVSVALISIATLSAIAMLMYVNKQKKVYDI